MSRFKVGDVIVCVSKPLTDEGDWMLCKCMARLDIGKQYRVGRVGLGCIVILDDDVGPMTCPDYLFEIATAVPADADDKALAWVKRMLANVAAVDRPENHTVFAVLSGMMEEVYGLQTTIVPASVTFTPVGQE